MLTANITRRWWWVNECIKEFVWVTGETRVVWESKDLGENLFHDALHKTANSTGVRIRDLNNYDLKNIQRIELAQEEGWYRIFVTTVRVISLPWKQNFLNTLSYCRCTICIPERLCSHCDTRVWLVCVCHTLRLESWLGSYVAAFWLIQLR